MIKNVLQFWHEKFFIFVSLLNHFFSEVYRKFHDRSTSKIIIIIGVFLSSHEDA